MKAIVYRHYGSPDALRYEDADKPVPVDHEVLIKVRAAAVNPLDWHFMRGTPYMVRMLSGFSKPKFTRLGVDVAGVIESVGKGVTQFKPGDAVFGKCRGAFAEYVCTPESSLVMKPNNSTFDQAACAHVAGLSALQGLRDHGKLTAGQKVLINGAAGGVGTFAVQIAKWLGAEVTGVCSSRNIDMIRSIGADRVIDYTKEDFTQSEHRFDLILDCIGNHSLSARRRVLTPNGICVMVGGPNDGPWIGPMVEMVNAVVFSKFVSQQFVMMLAKSNRADLQTMQELMQNRKVTPVIDRSYTLSEVPDAIRYLEAGHARGKVVIDFNEAGT
jgi:NADPH:quinone reductase-like Zn-dependent oxidoreductase